jgi:hypothetical protein
VITHAFSLQNLVNDESQYVRAALAGDVMGLAPLIGKEHTTEYLLDVFLKLLKDENAEVRLNIISKLEPVSSRTSNPHIHLMPFIVIDLYIISLFSFSFILSVLCFRFRKLLGLKCWRSTYFPLLLNLPEIDSGAFVCPSSHTFLSWLHNW